MVMEEKNQKGVLGIFKIVGGCINRVNAKMNLVDANVISLHKL